MNQVQIILHWPSSFKVEQVGKQQVRISIPTGDGKLFSTEAERFATSLLGPREGAMMLDSMVDRFFTEIARLSATDMPEKRASCDEQD